MPTKGGVSPNTVVELEQLLKTLESDREELKKRVEEQLADYERRIAALLMTLGMVIVTADGTNNEASGPKLTRNDLRTRFEGLSQFEAMVKLAEDSPKRTVRPTDVAPILQGAGLAKGDKANLVSHLYRMLRESQRFEKVAPGSFRLKIEQAKPLRGTAAGISTFSALLGAAANEALRPAGGPRFPIRPEATAEEWQRAVDAARARAQESKKPNTNS